MDRLMVISADTHAGARPEMYREFLESRYHRRYEEWLEAFRRHGYHLGGTRVKNSSDARIQELEEEDRSAQGRHGLWDPAIRARELDREGLAGEVIFPDGTMGNHVPFGVGLGDPRMDTPLELVQAGTRAHNRWLSDFCGTREPERHAGVAVVIPDDVSAAVREIEWSCKAGLRGGVMLRGMSLLTDEPTKFWNHSRYEPIWEACASLGVPLNAHSGSGSRVVNYGENLGSRWIASIEIWLVAFRMVWFLLWGGVFHRHPKLKVVVTEAGSGGLLYLCELLDYMAERRNPDAVREIFPLKPSEYIHRQVHIGASTPSHRYEIEARHQIGIDKIMWGSDYPHAEGAWPHSRERLKEMFAEVPEGELRMMVGENAASLFGFDVVKLNALAQRIGPTAADLGAAASAVAR